VRKVTEQPESERPFKKKRLGEPPVHLGEDIRTVSAFEEPLRIAALLARFRRPWFVAAGWAVDLYLGRVTRQHKDLEIAILRRDQHALRRYLQDWEFKKVKRVSGEGEGRLEPWAEDESLKLPTHEIHAQSGGGGLTKLEILLNECSGQDWIFRRNPEIKRPVSLIGLLSQTGVPFLAPEIVLLYKAKNPKLDDEADFNKVAPLLKQEPRAWLRWAIEACHPGHPWLSEL
jgi:hypothetical protein